MLLHAAQHDVEHRVDVRLTVTLDAEYLHTVAARRGVPVDRVVQELAAALECKAFDAVRWTDGVANLGVQTSS